MGPPSSINESQLDYYGKGEAVRFKDDIRLNGLVVLKPTCSPWGVLTRCELEDADFVVQGHPGERWHGFRRAAPGEGW